MKVAEILRSLANLIDAEHTPVQQPVVVNVHNGSAAAEQPAEEPVADDEIGIMVPPLQQKIELMKKAHGVDSVYDPADDDLDILKKNAGLSTTHQLDDDEPLEG
jgi:hypothetical protein